MSDSRPQRRRIVFGSFTLRSYIYAARNLVFGSPDKPLPSTFVRVSCAGSTLDSQICCPTRFPVYLEALEVPCRLPIDAYEGLPSIAYANIEIHQTEIYQTKCIGACATTYGRILGKSDIESGSAAVIRPEWLKLIEPQSTIAAGKVPHGDVLIALELLKTADAQRVAVQPILPVVYASTIRISLWGLRDLVPCFKNKGTYLLTYFSH